MLETMEETEAGRTVTRTQAVSQDKLKCHKHFFINFRFNLATNVIRQTHSSLGYFRNISKGMFEIEIHDYKIAARMQTASHATMM